jgi:hypothetical protein
MNKHLLFLTVMSLGMVACSERPPIDWMYSEYKSLYSACPETGKKIERKSSTASLTYTWSCPYPENFEVWLSEFEVTHLNPRGWQKGKLPPPPYAWITYCAPNRNVVMRITKLERDGEAKKLTLNILFPADECQSVGVLKSSI